MAVDYATLKKGGFMRRQIVVVGSKATWEINPTEASCGGRKRYCFSACENS